LSRSLDRVLRTFCLTAVLALGGAAFAQTPPGRPPVPPRGGVPAPTAPVAQRVEVELQVVHATNDSTVVDPNLDPAIVKHLRFLNYTGYRLLDTRTASLALKQETIFPIEGGRKVRIQLLDRTDEEAKLRVRMMNGTSMLLDTTVSIHRNRSFIVAGPRHEGGVLVLPVTARY